MHVPSTLALGLTVLTAVAAAAPVGQDNFRFDFNNEQRALENTPSSFHHAGEDTLTLHTQVFQRDDLSIETSDSASADSSAPFSSSTFSFSPKKWKWYKSKTVLGPLIGIPTAAITLLGMHKALKPPIFVPKLGSAFGKRDDGDVGDVGEVYFSGGEEDEDEDEKTN